MSISSRENGRGNGRAKTPLCSFTPVEQKIMDVLCDSKPHLKSHIVHEVGEGYWSDANLRIHLTNIRKKLPPGHEIICQVDSHHTYFRYLVTPE